MFRLIGGAVVYGFALYGVLKLLDRRRPVVSKADVSTTSADAQPDDANVSKESNG